MGMSGAQQWWEEWQLRILVLGSLFVHSILGILASQRKHAIPSLLRSTIWLMYIGGDALAIYAFATLFSRQKEHGGSRTLELMWAPVLLVHLGGQASITAYNLEDSKLWKQHVIILVSKVTITLYIFIKWWPISNNFMLSMSAISLLILGILKFMEKPLVLRRGSYERLLSTIVKSPRSREHHEISLQEYVRLTNQYIREAVVGEFNFRDVQNVIKFSLTMLADLPASYSDRLEVLQSFLNLGESAAYFILQRCHGNAFQRLYTKMDYTYSVMGCYCFCVPGLGSASVTGFFLSKKDGYNVNDVRVTYILLICGTLLDFLALFSENIVDGTSWHRMVPQYRLMSFCTLRKKLTILMKLATFKCIQKYLHEHWYIGQVPVALQITTIVRQQVWEMWNMYIHNVASYKVYNNCRGQWTLHRLVPESDHRQQLGQSLAVPFDESVLLWHIATDLCFHHANASPQDPQDDTAQRSREISNYMFYLLSLRPEMLMPGTKPDMFTVASDDVDRILKDSNAPINNEQMLARQIIDMMKPTATTTETGTLIADACRLAETLMELGDEKKRWQVIQGVWVEMLCYSAARCRGYLHTECLGNGGEYLSYVWLLWAFMGMETLADKIQSPEPPGEEEISAADTGFPVTSLYQNLHRSHSLEFPTSLRSTVRSEIRATLSFP